MNVWIVEDDDSVLAVFTEDLTDAGHRVRAFEDIMQACLASGSPDALLIDISAIAPINLGPSACYSQIANFVCKHPHCPVHIVSGVSSQFMDDVVDRVLGIEPDAMVRHHQIGSDFRVCEALATNPPRREEV